MVDFGALGDKAKDLAGEHSEQVDKGIDKVGDAAGDKFGHDKVDGVTDKAKDAVGGLGGGGQAAADPAKPTDPAQADPAAADQAQDQPPV